MTSTTQLGEPAHGDILVDDNKLYVQEEERPDSYRPRTEQATIGSALSKSRILTPEGEQQLFKQLRFVDVRAKAIKSTLDPKKPNKKSIAELEQLKTQRESTLEEITKANLRLVASIARKLSRSEQDFDEFFSEGTSILLYAIEKFDYKRGFRFSTYATHSVQRHLYRVIQRRQKRSQHEFAGDQEMLANEAEQGSEDEFSPEATLAITEEVLKKVDELLDGRERTIVLGRFGLDGTDASRSFRELGEQMGLSKERVRQLFNSGIAKLGQAMEPFADQFE